MTDEEKAAAEKLTAEQAAAEAAKGAEPTEEEKKAAEEAKAAEDAAKAEEEKKKKDAEHPKEYTKKDLEGLRKSYQRETRQERDARIAAETEAKVLRELLEKNNAEPAKTTQATKPVRPKTADFATTEEYDAAMDKYEDARDAWKDAEGEKKAAIKNHSQETERARNEMIKRVDAQLETGRKEYEDFEDVVINNPDFRQTPLLVATLAKMKNGHDIVYHLGKNLVDADRLARIKDPVELAAEIGEISVTVKAAKAAKVAKKEEPPKKETTKAPQPPATVAAKAKVSTDTSIEGKTREERMRVLEQRSVENRKSGAWQRA